MKNLAGVICSRSARDASPPGTSRV